MIKDREAFETALEKASAYLARPPAPDTQDDADFERLMLEIEAYEASVDDQRKDAESSSELTALSRRLTDFRKQLADERRPAVSGREGEPMNPLLGGDVGGR